MPRLVDAVPKYRRHRASGQAIVTVSGRDHYLGPWKSRASRVEYDRLVGEWIAAGRPSHVPSASHDLTIVELVRDYWEFAQRYYRKNGRPTNELPGLLTALRTLKAHYGHTRAADFGPLALKALREKFVEAGHSRGYVNQNVGRLKRMFRWAASEEKLGVTAYQALATVSGLRSGKTEARESAPVLPVSDFVVEQTLPYLPEVVADMVRLQRLTGARPGEICSVRPCDVDTSASVWCYVPDSHKTQHHGRERRIYIGPRGQDVLRSYLLRDKSSFCFVPAESEARRNAERRERRKSPMTPSQAARRPKRRPLRSAGKKYANDAYRRAITRAVELANRERKEHDKLPNWKPNQLRHAAATEIRRQYGLEAAQVALGHASADITQVYAERDQSKAIEVARAIG